MENPIGLPVASTGDVTVRWFGGYSRSWDDAMTGMFDRFHEVFTAVENSGAIWDQEVGDWFSMVEVLDEVSAMDEVFGELREDVRQEIAPRILNEVACGR